MVNERILIVEDEFITAKSLEEYLKSVNYCPIAICESGEDAIIQALALKPDLILMDVKLKGNIDGIKATQQIRSQIDVPVIFLTAYGDLTSVNKAKVTGPFGYIVKPFTLERDIQPVIEIALYTHNKMKTQKKELTASDRKLKQIKEVVDQNHHEQPLEIPYNGNLSRNVPVNNENFIEAWGILSNNERFKIFSEVKKQALNFDELQNKINKTHSTISHHLQQLKKIGLIISHKDGRYSKFSRNNRNMAKFLQFWDKWLQSVPNFPNNLGMIDGNPMDQEEIEFTRLCLEAIGNPERFSILTQIKERRGSIKNIMQVLQKSQSTVSHHLKILEDAQLIQGVKNKKFTEYHLAVDSLVKFTRNIKKE